MPPTIYRSYILFTNIVNETEINLEYRITLRIQIDVNHIVSYAHTLLDNREVRNAQQRVLVEYLFREIEVVTAGTVIFVFSFKD